MEHEPQEPKIEFTDKRRVRPDDVAPEGEPPHAEPEPETPAAATTTAPADEDSAQELPSLDVYGLLKTTIGLLANGAWAWMGLTHNPFSGEMDRDLAQAKIAIDTVAYLVGQLDPHLTDEERRELQNLVSMLRINYVQQTQGT